MGREDLVMFRIQDKRVLVIYNVMNKIRKRTDTVVAFTPRVFQGIISTREREYTTYGFRLPKDTNTGVGG